MKYLKKLSDYIAKGSKFLSCIFIIIMAIALMAQVVLRFVFNSGLNFAAELSKYSAIWAVMLVANVLIKEEGLITVDLLDHLWPKKFVKWRDSFYEFLILILLFFLVKEGWEQAAGAMNHRLASINIAWFYPYLAIPVGALLMLYQYIFKILTMWKRSH